MTPNLEVHPREWMARLTYNNHPLPIMSYHAKFGGWTSDCVRVHTNRSMLRTCLSEMQTNNIEHHYSSFSFQCFDTVGWVTGRPSSLQKAGCWFVGGDNFDWSIVHLRAPDVTSISIILISNKIQNGDILVPAYLSCPGKWPLNEC